MKDPTPEEAAAYIEKIGERWEDWEYKPGCPCPRCIAKDIDAAVREENEACAQLALNHESWGGRPGEEDDVATRIADLIRARVSGD
jgi:hypothetical protein